MRELKFRVWCKRTQDYHTQIDYDAEPNGPWLQMCIDTNGRLYFIETSNEDVDYEYVTHDCEIIENQNDNFIIEQYTGLKDKNGKEIYEGDIVENTYENVGKVRYEVKWDCGRFIMTSKNPYNLVQIGMGIYPNSSKVIGNIHENPELLGDTNVTNKEEE